jgi:hypothetical protein
MTGIAGERGESSPFRTKINSSHPPLTAVSTAYTNHSLRSFTHQSSGPAFDHVAVSGWALARRMPVQCRCALAGTADSRIRVTTALVCRAEPEVQAEVLRRR